MAITTGAVTESLSANAASSAVVVGSNVVAAADSSDVSAAIVISAAGISEQLAATSSELASRFTASAITESTSAASSSAGVLVVNLVEPQTISDAWSVATDVAAALTETLHPIDESVLRGDQFAFQVEAADATMLTEWLGIRVPFGQPFHPYYNEWSARNGAFEVPAHFDVFDPDHIADPTCLFVMAPSPERGASVWTKSDKWISIGVYEDTGRTPATSPWYTASWIREGRKLTLVTTDGNGIQPADFIEVTGGNDASLARCEVIDANGTAVSIAVPDTGGTTGTCQYRLLDYDFSQRRIVFRLLPSYKLLSLAEVDALAQLTAPEPSFLSIAPPTTRVEIPHYSLTKNKQGYPDPKKREFGRVPTRRRFGQVYDNAGKPLPLKYNAIGLPESSSIIRAGTPMNDVLFFGSPMVSEGDGDDTRNTRPYVYDMYGLDLNDPLRAPHFSTSVISRNSDGSINRATDSQGAQLYSGPIFDVFGNEVVGISADNTLVVKQHSIPIDLDRFYRPARSPR